MSELAMTHLRQARSFVRAGDPGRAVELLEKARVLARGNADLQGRVLEQLAESYEAIGRFEQASRCREQLSRLGPRASQAGVTLQTPAVKLRPTKSSATPWIIGGAVALVALCTIAIAIVLYVVNSKPAWHDISVALNSAAPTTLPSPATRPTTQKAASPDHAQLAAVPEARVDPPLRIDRQDMLKETVGLIVVVVHFKGPVGNGNAQIDLALGSGTAFAVSSSGLMVTNKHVVDADKEVKIPPTLEKAGMPTVTYRGMSYVICFGPSPMDRYEAKLLHKSEQCDMALLKIDHHFDHPLVLANKELRQGDDILVCGYPGAVMAALNQASHTPARIIDVSRKWQTAKQVDAFDEFSPESFNSTLTKGIVSAPERNVDGAGYMQIDAVISPGNSGGPVLNLDNEVVAIATFGLRSPTAGGGTANYNFALLVGQLVPELTPYLRD